MKAPLAVVRPIVVPVPVPSAAYEMPAILRKVISNPYYLCTAGEIALCIGKNPKFVSAAHVAGAPFPGGVSRPEWILAWLQANPEFDLKMCQRN